MIKLTWFGTPYVGERREGPLASFMLQHPALSVGLVFAGVPSLVVALCEIGAPEFGLLAGLASLYPAGVLGYVSGKYDRD